MAELTVVGDGGGRSARRASAEWCGAAGDWCLVGFMTLLPVFHLRPWSLIATGLLFAAAGLASAAALIRGALGTPRSAALALFLVYLLLSALSTFVSDDPLASSTEAFRVLLKSLLIVLVIACGPADEARLRRLALGPAFAAVGLCVLVFAYAAAGTRNRWGGVTGPEIGYNAIAMFLVAAVPFVLARTAGPGRRRWAWSGAAALTLATILLTFSRIGWAALAVVLAVWLALVREGRLRLLGAALLAAAAFVLAAPDLGMVWSVTDTPRALAGAALRGGRAPLKSMSLRDIANLDGRVEFGWEPAIGLIRSRPLAGSGFGEGTFARRLRGGPPVLVHEHDALLSVAVQSGIPTACVYLGVLVVAAVSVARRVARRPVREDARRLVGVATLASLSAEYLIHGIAEPTNTGRMGLMLAVLIGLAVVVSSADRRRMGVPGPGPPHRGYGGRY